MVIPVKKYGIARPSFALNSASTSDCPVRNTSPMRASTRARSSPSKKSSGLIAAISVGAYPVARSKFRFHRRNFPFSS